MQKKSKIFGFRSGKIIKKIISIFYMFFCSVFLIACVCISKKGQITTTDYMIDKAAYVIMTLWMVSPYIFLSETSFRDKIPFFKQHKISSSFLGMTMVSGIFLVLLAAVYMSHSLEYKEDMKNHAYSIESTTAATCDKHGLIKYVCDYCGTTSAEDIESLGHKMIEVSRREASYAEQGEIVEKCEVCGMQNVIVLDKLINDESEALEDISSAIESENISEQHENSIYDNFSSESFGPETESSAFEYENSYEEDYSFEISEEISDDTSEEGNSIYQELTDEQFGLLTEILTKSFYNFQIDEPDYQRVSADDAVNECLKNIYSYAYSNYFELEPEYKKAISLRYDVVSKIPNYKELQENFIVEHYRDNEKAEWVFQVSSYTINPDDTIECDDKIYVDAEGYLNPGVLLYMVEEGKIVNVGEVEEVAYKKEINGEIHGYAFKIKYYDDPFLSGWVDGEHMLTTNKKLTGKSIFYVDVLDSNRNVFREEIDYGTGINWKSLTYSNAKSGVKVYSGILNSKSYLFTIISTDILTDIMIVQYPSGSIEIKSFSAMINKGCLYIK